MEISMFLGPLAGSAPALIFWIAVIIFAVIMLRRGGGRGERFLIAGAGLKIVSNLLSVPAIGIYPWLAHEGYSMEYSLSVISGYGIFCNIVGMAGIACLIYGFWVKFKAGKSDREVTQSSVLERGNYDTGPEYGRDAQGL